MTLHLARAHFFLYLEGISYRKKKCRRYRWESVSSFTHYPSKWNTFQVVEHLHWNSRIPKEFIKGPASFTKPFFPGWRWNSLALLVKHQLFTCLRPRFSYFFLHFLLSFLHLSTLGSEINPTYSQTSTTSCVFISGSQTHGLHFKPCSCYPSTHM